MSELLTLQISAFDWLGCQIFSLGLITLKDTYVRGFYT